MRKLPLTWTVVPLGLLALSCAGACGVADALTADTGVKADAGQAADSGVAPADCTGKSCGDLLPDGSICFGPCDDAALICAGGPAWACVPGADPCAAAVHCGDTGTDGKSCPGDGTCADPALVCDTVTWTCIADPCKDKGCGDVVNDYLCMGPCQNPWEECKVDPADAGKVTCAACNINGAGVDEACTEQAACKCGEDCVKLLQDDAACPTDPAKCQETGLCLEDCFWTGACPNGKICACTKADATNNCLTGDCFTTGTLKGNFSGAVLSSCADAPAKEDYGQGNMTGQLADRTATWDRFIGCRYLPADGTEGLVIVQGFSGCGAQACPDLVLIAFTPSVVKTGTLGVADGILAEWDEATVIGTGAETRVTDLWVRAFGIDGTVNLTQAGTTGRASIAGTTDIKLIKYDYESCGDAIGTACQ